MGVARGFRLMGLLWMACALAITDVSARDLQPGIIGSDDRRVVDELSGPWAAIGQVNVSGYRRAHKCTGALVGSNLVVTAAHCVMDPWRKKPFPFHQIHFLAGVKGSSWLGHSIAKCLHFHPDYEYIGPAKILPNLPFQRVPRRALSRDVVLIVLEDELTNVAPLGINRGQVPISDVSLAHLSYAADRRYILSGHFGCHVLARENDLWFTDCDTHAASSGGPVLVEDEKDLKLLAIMVGVVSKSASIAVPTTWIHTAARTCP